MGRGWFRWVVVACLCGLPAACGGKVVQQGGTSSTGGADGGSNSTAYPSHSLGECHPGPLLADATTCPWLGDDGRCYQTVDAACNCVCPRDHASLCVSGFPGGPESRVKVSCN